MKHEVAFGLAIFLIAWLSIAGCAGVRKLLGDDDPAPSGRYESLAITGGSLLVSRGECSYPDLDTLQRRANVAVENMRAAWPASNVSVHSLPVSFSRDPWAGSIQATGIYHADGRWIELRCPDYEFVIEHELGHALAHKMGLWCWRTIGHGLNLDCSA